MKGSRKTTFVLVLAAFVAMLTFQFGFAANQDYAPTYVSEDETINIMQNIGVNSSGANSTLEFVVINFTGSGTPDISNITNLSLYNQSNSVYFAHNDTGAVNGVWNLTGDINISVEDQNFTLNLTLNSTVQDGMVIDVKVTELGGVNVTNSTKLSYDPSGNTTVDASKPSIIDIDPQEGEDYSSYVNVSANFTDSVSGVNISRWRWINSSTWSSNWFNASDPNVNFTNVNDTTGLDDGDYNITFWANDSAGNENETNVSLYIDNSDPLLVTPPVNYTAQLKPQIILNITDPLLNESSINFSFNGSLESFENSSISDGLQISYNVSSNLTEGESYWVNVSAKDIVNNELTMAEGGLNFTVDLSAPSITNFTIEENNFTTPAGNRVYNTSNLTLNWTANDTFSDVDNFVVFARNRTCGGNWTENLSIITQPFEDSNYTVENLTDEYEYQFVIGAEDSAGNKNNSVNLTAIIDSDGPSFVESTVEQENWTNANMNLDVNITDISNIENDSIQLYVDGSPIDSSNYSVSPSIENESCYRVYGYWLNGTHGGEITINITATDTLNKTTNSSFVWNMDTEDPDISVETIEDFDGDGENGEWYKDEVNYTVSCTDTLSGPAEYYYEIESESVNETYSGHETSHNFTLSTDGNNTYEFKCTDRAGNINTTETFAVAIDTGINITDWGPTGDSVSNGTRVFVEVDEPGIGINKSKFEVDIRSLDVNEEDFSWDGDELEHDVNDLELGEEYEVNVTVYDNFSYEVTREWTFTASSESSTSQPNQQVTPSLDIENLPDMGEVERGSDNDFEVTIENDGNLNLDDVEYELEIDNVDGLSVSFDPDSVDIDAGEEEDITVEISAEEDAELGTFDATFFVNHYGEGISETDSMEIEVKEKVAVTSNISAIEVDGPDSVDIDKKGNKTFNVTVENNGEDGISLNASFNVSDDLDVTIDPSSFELSKGNDRTVDIFIDALFAKVGVYEGVLKFEYDGVSTKKEIDIKIQPNQSEIEGMNSTLEDYDIKLMDLRGELDSLSKQSDFEELNSTLSEVRGNILKAQESIDKGDGARAKELMDEIDSSLNAMEDKLSKAPKSGFPWLYLVMGIVAALVLGFLIYLNMPEGKEGYDSESGYNPKKEEDDLKSHEKLISAFKGGSEGVHEEDKKLTLLAGIIITLKEKLGLKSDKEKNLSEGKTEEESYEKNYSFKDDYD